MTQKQNELNFVKKIIMSSNSLGQDNGLNLKGGGVKDVQHTNIFCTIRPKCKVSSIFFRKNWRSKAAI